jgi:uncharacterized membrane protein
MKLQFIGSGDAFGSGGRFNTCFLVSARERCFLIDCGASSMVALRRWAVDPNAIETVFVSHLHGDHFGGPPGLRQRLLDAMENFFPGSTGVTRKFTLEIIGSLRFTAYAMIVASVCCIVQFLAMRNLATLDLPLAFYGLAIAMAIGSTVISTYLMNEALGRIGANQVALLGALGPVLTILLGYLGLDEVMTGLQAAGGALVLVGVLLVTVRPAPGR